LMSGKRGAYHLNAGEKASPQSIDLSKRLTFIVFSIFDEMTIP